MKCQNCDGNGRFEVEDNGVVMQGVYWRCPNCGGKGIVEPLTNEEWFCGLSTEEKAKWMAKHMSFCEVCEIQTCRGDGCQRFDRGSMTETDAFREWLKEKHI